MSQLRAGAPIGRREAVLDRYDFYRDVLRRLLAADVPFLVGGAFAHKWVTGVSQHTKDLDLFVRPRDRHRLFAVVEAAGYRTSRPFPHWLGKVHWNDDVVDVIHSSGNGEAPVDDDWFAHSMPAMICGLPVRICPIEEMIWTKAFIMERERFDGADIAHLFRACAEQIDWARLRARFGEHQPVLLVHLVLFGHIYPGERHRIPRGVVAELVEQVLCDWTGLPADPKLCRGGLLSRAQYFPDFADWGYHDARVPPHGRMTAGEARNWTAAAPALPRARRRGRRIAARRGQPH